MVIAGQLQKRKGSRRGYTREQRVEDARGESDGLALEARRMG